MTFFQKAFLLIVGYALFYFISIRSFKENDNEYSETAIVVDFIEEKTFNGRTNGRFYYPEVLVVYNSDSQYFAKKEWNRFLNLTIGDEVNAKFTFEDIYSKSSDTTISSIKNLLTKEQIDSIENKIVSIEGFETIGYGEVIGQKLVDVEINPQNSWYVSKDKIFLHGFIFFSLILIIFGGYP